VLDWKTNLSNRSDLLVLFRALIAWTDPNCEDYVPDKQLTFVPELGELIQLAMSELQTDLPFSDRFWDMPSFVQKKEHFINKFGPSLRPICCDWIHSNSRILVEHFGVNSDGELRDGTERGGGGGPSILFTEFEFENPELTHYSVDQEGWGIGLTLDLDASDETLKADFDTFLTLMRTYTGIQSEKSHATLNKINKLQKYNILPYIDLMIWCEIHGKTIASAVILDTLFSSNEDIKLVGEPFIIQTLKPFYNKVMNEKFITSLESMSKNK